MVLVLDKRALWYRRKVQEVVDKDEALFNEASGETGTVLTEGLTDLDDRLQGTQVTIAQAKPLEHETFGGVSSGMSTNKAYI